MVRTVENFLARWFDPDYGGLSSTADYEYLVSSLGYAGYDSLITEKNFQDFTAYEYTVLMDVAEYIWKGQEDLIAEDANANKDMVYGPFAEYETVDGVKSPVTYEEDNSGDADRGPAYMPYLAVYQDYDCSKLTYADWLLLVNAGQNSARFVDAATKSTIEGRNAAFATQNIIMGGNRDVMPPTLTYEYKINPAEPDGTGSLVPYISVLKEQLGYHYFTVGSKADREHFRALSDPGNPHSGGVNFVEGGEGMGNQEGVQASAATALEDRGQFQTPVVLMEVSNIMNPKLKKSTAWSNYAMNTSIDNNDFLIKADDYDDDSTFEQQLYFTNEYASVVYKTPLQIMIDRFLPKSSLLTAWYYLKDTDIASGDFQGKDTQTSGRGIAFDVASLMGDIRRVYDYYCFEGETLKKENVTAVTYSGDGTIARDNSGEAIMEQREIRYDNTNKKTFIHFGQAGIEANIFPVLNFYEPTGEHAGMQRPEAAANVTGDPDEATIPVITELVSDYAKFLDRLGFKVSFNYDYEYTYEKLVTASNTVYLSETCVSAGHVCNMVGYEYSVNAIKNLGANRYLYKTPKGHACTGSCSFWAEGVKTVSASEAVLDDSGNSTIGWKVSVDASYWKEEEGTYYGATGKIVMPYEATNNESPRGDSYQMDDISQMVHDQVILRVEYQLMQEPQLKAAAAIDMEKLESEFVNHAYVYPQHEEDVRDNVGSPIEAKPYDDYLMDYKRSLAFYNFSEVARGSKTDLGTMSEADILAKFEEYVNSFFSNLSIFTTAPLDPFSGVAAMDSPTFYEDLEAQIIRYLELYYCEALGDGTYREPLKRPSPTLTGTTRNFKFTKVSKINSITIETDGGTIAKNVDTNVYQLTNLLKFGDTLQISAINAKAGVFTLNGNKGYNNGLIFTALKDVDTDLHYKAIFDVDEYVISMTQQINQKRLATMIIIDVESWAKSAKYDIKIVNNTFDYTNFRYVVPHSYYSFGVRVFKIDEKAGYRTDYYKEYFSKVNDPTHVGIKEADILTMMLKWEEYARSGVDTAYAFMRDLYKLVIYTRERFSGDDAQILDSAYSYLYVPDTIWEFREGISQEAFWTERLAAEVRRR